VSRPTLRAAILAALSGWWQTETAVWVRAASESGVTSRATFDREVAALESGGDVERNKAGQLRKALPHLSEVLQGRWIPVMPAIRIPGFQAMLPEASR
jgi:hypothetical protein